MAKDIKATLTHCSSTDKNPNHENCPPGPAGWCFYNNARAKNEEPKSHSEMSIRLTPELVKRMEPLYNRLSDEKLLSRCARGATQNANESLHALVWRYCPKTVFVTRPRLELAVAHAVAEFNMGTLGALFLRKRHSGDNISGSSEQIAKTRDSRRKQQSEKQKKRTTGKRLRKIKGKKQAAAARKKGGKADDDYQAGGF